MSARGLFWVVPLGFAVALGAQAPPNIAQGLGPAGAYQTGGVDNINLMNGGLNLTIPLGGGAGQRGAVSAQTVVVMNSKGFVVSGGQWTGSAMTFQVVNPQRITVALVSDSPQYHVATTADGSTHILEGGVEVNGVSYPGYWATDGSGIHYDSTADIATDRDGVRTLNAKSGPTAIEDPNGNEITLLSGGGFTDTLGRTGGQPVATGDLTGCTGGATSAKNFTFPGANGNSYTYKLCYIDLSIQTAFGAPGVAEENALHQAVTTVIRPDGAAWSFTYAAGYADLQAVTLPTGGTITYTWATESFGTGSTRLELLGREQKPLSALVNPLRARYFASGEINFEVPDAPGLLERAAATFADGAHDRTDGLSVAYPDWRFNLRSSNTEPLLRLNVEARSQAALDQGLARVQALIGVPPAHH